MLRRAMSLAALLAMSVMTWAQDTRGTISGRVTDPSGAAVAGATVLVTNTAMGTKENLTTNAEGIYRATFLNPGMYQIEASASGFNLPPGFDKFSKK